MKRIITFVLVISLCLTVVNSTKAAASVNSTESLQMSDERSNYQYILGKPGDKHLVYTYESDGTTYKVDEEASDDFSRVDSIIYKKVLNGTYVECAKQTFTVNNSVFRLETNINEEKFVDIQNISYSNAQESDLDQDMLLETYASDTYNGYEVTGWKYIDSISGSNKIINYTITAVTAIITFIITDGVSGGAGAAAAGVSAVVSKIIDERLKVVYYYHNYYEKNLVNPPLSLRNFVVGSCWRTTFYKDKAHTKRIRSVGEMKYQKGYGK